MDTDVTGPDAVMRPHCVIVGAGGHARVVAGILERLGETRLIGVLDRTAETTGERIGFSKIIGAYDLLSALITQGVGRVYLAIGDNAARQSLTMRCWREGEGLALPPLIHPTAILEPGAEIGDGTVLCAGAIIGANARVGRGCIINTGASVDHETIIGDFVHLCPGVRIAGRCKIGHGCFVGIGAVVRDYIEIGARSTVGAGAVVVSHVPDGIVAIGVPARPRRSQ
ncbi:MAG: acetyltransferase [Chromatiaceae bacterium]|nr:acetyltransferase [Chromatiaceae bacterium]